MQFLSVLENPGWLGLSSPRLLLVPVSDPMIDSLPSHDPF